MLPVYVSVGLAWEAAEIATVERLLRAPVFTNRAAPLRRVELTMRDVYTPEHWAIRGEAPEYDTPDEDVYLAGRNLLLLTKAGVVAALDDVHRISLGLLAGNPFPDARPAFLATMGSALSLGLDHPIEIATPFLTWQKADVITRGVELAVPLEHTLSCMGPLVVGGLAEHCGLCSKCRERRDGFLAAQVRDPTTYANQGPR